MKTKYNLRVLIKINTIQTISPMQYIIKFYSKLEKMM